MSDRILQAFGDAASICLQTFINGAPKLSGLIAYYPSSIPDAKNATFSPSLQVVVHLAGDQIGVNRNQAVLGIQGKRRTVTKRLTSGLGTGGTQDFSFPCYTYHGAQPGFAEHDLDEYDRISDGIAWARSLAAIRSAFSATTDIEHIWDRNEEFKYRRPNAAKLMQTFNEQPPANVIYTPTLTGGWDKDSLSRFYEDFFLPSLSSSNDTSSIDLKTRLISRTIGSTSIVDELFVSFIHNAPVPWILPGVPPTHKPVEIVIVSIVGIRGGKLISEHVYWDQASVLVQTGLLDPEKDVKNEWKEKGMVELPIFGRESARKMVDENSEELNELIEEW